MPFDAGVLWTSIAQLGSRLVSFDRILIAILESPSAVRLYAIDGGSRIEERQLERNAFSRLLWPEPLFNGLRNALERAMILCEGGLISSEHLPLALGQSPRAASSIPDAPETLPPQGVDLEAIERDLVRKALKQAGDNKSKAARLLGLTRAQLYSRIEKHGL